ncbi:MAG: hypothetical protein RL536_314 [Candidatus Parcubacteria bacterium]
MKYQDTVSVIKDADLQGRNITSTAIKATAKIFTDPLNGTYYLDDQEITFINGKSEEGMVPGSAFKAEGRIFGKPVYGDLNGDGKNDAIFFISQETGGTGIFFYVLAAINQGNDYVGTAGVFLGDRISPQNINIKNGYAAVNYSIRKEGEPMVAIPSVGVSKFLTVRGGRLVEGNVSDYSPNAPIKNNNQGSTDVFSSSVRETNTSNMIGVFGGVGGFSVDVPDWMAQNWWIDTHDAEYWEISPRYDYSRDDFGPIGVTVRASVEDYNAKSSYDYDLTHTPNIKMRELILASDDATRIYHIEFVDGSFIVDKYYADSALKTIIVRFQSSSPKHDLYEPKIREFVETLSKGLGEQG